MRVAICIGTFRRVDLLRDLLRGVSRLKFQRVPAPEIEVIVVDNDPSASAQKVCETADLANPVRYVVESRRGIVQVRNRALAEAAGSDFIAFLDDDEVPSEEWLDALLATQEQFAADVVCGPVHPVYATGVADWVKRGGFFERPEFETGRALEFCSTNNVLARSEVFVQLAGFDKRFQLTGGEDTQFFLRAGRAGYKIVWSQEAVVREFVPSERATLGWILRRGYQSGNSWVLSEMSIEASAKLRFVRFAKGFAYVVIGMISALVSVFVDKAAFAKALRKVCLGAGMLAGLAGRKYLAYQSAGAVRLDPAAELSERSSGRVSV